MNHMYDKTLEIARKKLEFTSSSPKIHRPRLGTGGGFQNLFLWDTAFTAMWAKYHQDILPVKQSLDNFYRLQDSDGHINREYLPNGTAKWPKRHPVSFAPPVISWTELQLFDLDGDMNRLKSVYPHLKRLHYFNENHYRGEEGLYFGDPLGCGMDNLPRWPRGWEGNPAGLKIEPDEIICLPDEMDHKKYADLYHLTWNIQGRYVDMSSQMAFDKLNLFRIAGILGKQEEEQEFLTSHRHLSEEINTHCWDENMGFYCDTAFNQIVPRYHIGGFWPLLAEVAPKERAERVIQTLTDSDLFATPVPVPSLARSETCFEPLGEYWRGGVWAPTNYMILQGLKTYGRFDLAQAIADVYYRALKDVFKKTGTLFENYAPMAPLRGNKSGSNFVGWSGLGPVAIFREFLAGKG